MSLFGAMNTAISGLSSQAAAFTNISNDVSNSQTVGFKRVDTSFEDYLTVSNASVDDPGATVAIPDYINSVQGTVSQTQNPLNMAITGGGFFPVSTSTGTSNGVVQFSPQPAYTRAGDFTMNSSGYITNSAGDYLNAWSINPTTGIVDASALSPIQVAQTVYNPVATSSVTLAANLPATPTAGQPVQSQVSVYDALGNPHQLTLTWTQNPVPAAGATPTTTNDWTVTIATDASGTGETTNIGSAEVKFGAVTSGNPVPEGTIGSIGNVVAGTGAADTNTAETGDGLAATAYTANQPAALSFTANFGNGSQPITLNLGNYGQSNGVTQYAGSSYTLQGLTQNGVPPGAFSSVTATSAGDIVVNYDNGQSRSIAKVPLVTFNAPDSLQAQNGQTFTETQTSGTPLTQAAGTNGAGTLVTSSVEQSNVDIASEFSQLIVAQQAYSANTKMITTAQQMLQQTIDMKQ